MVEYDIPVSILAETLGGGSYFEDEQYLEFLIPKEELVTSSNNITSNPSKKEEVFFQSLQDTMQSLKQGLFEETSNYNKFDTFQIYLKYRKILDQEEKKSQEIIKNSPLYQAFLTKDQEVYKSPYITGNYAYINESDISHAMYQGTRSHIFTEKNFPISDDCIKQTKTQEQELLSKLLEANIDDRKNILMKVRRN